MQLPPEKLDISIFGATGRMGQALIRLIDQAPELDLVGALERAGSERIDQVVNVFLSDLINTDDHIKFTAQAEAAVLDAHVVIDFALSEGIAERIQACRAAGVAMLIGTTGLSDEQQALIKQAGKDIPIAWASNMSLGVNLVFALAAHAARALGQKFSIQIDETHHVHNQDAPSGTALSIGDAITAVDSSAEINYQSFREGEVIGDHSVRFESANEVIEIKHHAKDRALFAEGALRLAALLANKPAGLYTVEDLI